MTFSVPGKPQGKARPRFTKKGHTYTPEQTTRYEHLIRHAFKLFGGEMIEEGNAVRLSVTAYFMPAKSTSKKNKIKMLLGKILPLKKPDGDNILKVVADSLNRVAYADDKQITDWQLKKRYAEKECLIVTVEEAHNETNNRGNNNNT